METDFFLSKITIRQTTVSQQKTEKKGRGGKSFLKNILIRFKPRQSFGLKAAKPFNKT
jgi:hypothetical protein